MIRNTITVRIRALASVQLLSVAMLLLMVVSARGQDNVRTIKVRFVGPDTVPVKMNLQCIAGCGTQLDQAYAKRCFEFQPSPYSPYSNIRTEKFAFTDPEKRITQLFLDVSVIETTGASLPRLPGSSNKIVPLPQLGDELTAHYAVNVSASGIAVAKMLDVIESAVVLDRTIKYVEVKETPPFRVPLGATERKRDEHTVRHSVSVKQGTTVSAELKAGWVFVEASIRGSIEKATERTYDSSKTSSREVEIKGGNDPIKLVWIETYRTGRAITIVNGRRHEIPFEFKDGWDLQSRAAK